MNEKFKNFLKVYFFAIVSDIKNLVILVFAIMISMYDSGLNFLIPLGIVFVLILSFIKSSDENFIKKILKNSSSLSSSSSSNFKEISFEDILKKVNNQRHSKRLFDEVVRDLDDCIFQMKKIDKALKSLPNVKKETTKFTYEYFDKIIDKLLYYSNREQEIREYLIQSNEKRLLVEIENLEKIKQNTIDKQAKLDYEQSIKLKNEKYKQIQEIKTNLEQIDANLMRLNTELENIHTYLMKYNLNDSYNQVRDLKSENYSEMLISSLKTMTDLESEEKQKNKKIKI